MLQLGSSGPKVLALQKALIAAGFSPGTPDGGFGAGTEAAVLAFQKSESLVADGSVNQATAAALGLPKVPPLPSAATKITVQVVARMFPQTPLGNIKTNLQPVLDAMVAEELADQAMLLMALATIRAETESFEAISEGISRFNTSPNGHSFDLYDNRKDLGNQGAPDGASFRGRGFVQLTGRNNYTTFGKQIGQDLAAHPELGNDVTVAAALLAHFLNDKEDAIRQALAHNDLATARKLVNGGSNGLDRFTNAYQVGLSQLS